MSDNYEFLEFTGAAPPGTAKRVAAALDVSGVLFQQNIALLPPDFNGNEVSGEWTLSATPGTVTTITLPNNARIVTVFADALVRVRFGADPAALGTDAFAAGSPCEAYVRRTFVLDAGTSRTLRVRSTVASAKVVVEARP
jgi:hypothetical protein